MTLDVKDCVCDERYGVVEPIKATEVGITEGDKGSEGMTKSKLLQRRGLSSRVSPTSEDEDKGRRAITDTPVDLMDVVVGSQTCRVISKDDDIDIGCHAVHHPLHTTREVFDGERVIGDDLHTSSVRSNRAIPEHFVDGDQLWSTVVMAEQPGLPNR